MSTFVEHSKLIVGRNSVVRTAGQEAVKLTDPLVGASLWSASTRARTWMA